MNTITKTALMVTGAIMLTATPALADDDDVTLVQCDESLGSIALVDGAQAGWQDWNLGSPRLLIAQLARESGCFTPHSGADGTPARFLVTAIAGTQDEVDQGVEIAKTAATEALVRSGAASGILSSVPFGGAALSMFGGFGGKKKTVSAGLTVVSPATGQPLAAGTGSVKKTSISFRVSNSWGRGYAETTGYADSKDGRKLTEAFIIAFNQLVAQRDLLAAAPQAGSSATTASATTAIDTVMRAGPGGGTDEVRSLRAGTELTPTGERSGLWIEATDNYGTKGWVSIEDMQ